MPVSTVRTTRGMENGGHFEFPSPSDNTDHLGAFNEEQKSMNEPHQAATPTAPPFVDYMANTNQLYHANIMQHPEINPNFQQYVPGMAPPAYNDYAAAAKRAFYAGVPSPTNSEYAEASKQASLAQPVPVPRRIISAEQQPMFTTGMISRSQENVFPQTPSATGVPLSPEQLANLQQTTTKDPKPKLEQKSSRLWSIWRSGYLEYGNTYTANASTVGSWYRNFAQLRKGEIRLRQSMESSPESCQTIPLNQDVYVAIQDRKYICIQSGEKLHVFRTKSDAECFSWFFAISSQAQTGPLMSGYCEKMSDRKKKRETRFLRLGSEGILTWYVSEADTSSGNGSIQLRGVTSQLKHDDPSSVVSRVGKRDFEFRFGDAEEARAWLEAFTWYTPRPPLKNNKIRNSAIA